MATKAEIYKELIEMINNSMEDIKVCIPSNDYYARPDDWSEETISVIRPQTLIMYLQQAIVEE